MDGLGRLFDVSVTLAPDLLLVPIRGTKKRQQPDDYVDQRLIGGSAVYCEQIDQLMNECTGLFGRDAGIVEERLPDSQ